MPRTREESLKWIDGAHETLSVRGQCRILGIHRSQLYYEPVPESDENLQLMRLMDEQYLKAPFWGSRNMSVFLSRRTGQSVNRKRIQRLMRKMGLEGIAPGPSTSKPQPGHKVYPYLLQDIVIERPEVEIISDVLKLDSYTEVEVSAGIFATCQATHWYRIKLGVNSQGEQTLLYEEAQTAQVVNGSRSNQGIEILKIVMLAITAILALLLLVLSGGTAAAVSVALLCLVIGEFVIEEIERRAQNDPPGIDQLVASANAPIVWPDSKDFTLNTAGINISLQLGGTWN